MLSRAYSSRGSDRNTCHTRYEFFITLGLFIALVLVPPVCAADSGTLSWTQVTGHAEFPPRYCAGMVVFEGKMWIIGGESDSGFFNDVWYSSDGTTWEEETAHAPFSPRAESGVTVFDNKLWIVGGRGPGAVPVNDVWYTEDGSTWTEATDHAAFAARYDPGLTVYDGKMWVVGGGTKPHPDQGYWSVANDVWSSSDGVTWVEATPSAGFSPRTNQGAVSFNGKMWVIDGWDGKNILGDVWYSSDGSSWVQVNGPPGFPERDAHQVVTVDGKLWVIGGQYGSRPLNDVWSSADGMSWTNSGGDNRFTPRAAFGAAVFKNRIWVEGGYNGSQFLNDVWSSDPIEDEPFDFGHMISDFFHELFS